MVMYFMMFAVALRLRFKLKFEHSVFTIPGRKIGTVITCIMGLIGCTITIAAGFIPPGNINIGSHFYYEMIFCSGMLAMILPVFVCYWYKKRSDAKMSAPLASDDLAMVTFTEK
jgi:amino acid transporter